jgi:hypothetical protein
VGKYTHARRKGASPRCATGATASTYAGGGEGGDPESLTQSCARVERGEECVEEDCVRKTEVNGMLGR